MVIERSKYLQHEPADQSCSSPSTKLTVPRAQLVHIHATLPAQLQIWPHASTHRLAHVSTQGTPQQLTLIPSITAALAPQLAIKRSRNKNHLILYRAIKRSVGKLQWGSNLASYSRSISDLNDLSPPVQRQCRTPEPSCSTELTLTCCSSAPSNSTVVKEKAVLCQLHSIVSSELFFFLN